MSFFLLHLRQRTSGSLPPVLLLFLLISYSLARTVSPSLSFALSSCSSLSCFCRVLSFYRLISRMTKRQRKDQIRADRRAVWNKRNNDGGGVVDFLFLACEVDETFDAGDSTCRVGRTYFSYCFTWYDRTGEVR